MVTVLLSLLFAHYSFGAGLIVRFSDETRITLPKSVYTLCDTFNTKIHFDSTTTYDLQENPDMPNPKLFFNQLTELSACHTELTTQFGRYNLNPFQNCLLAIKSYQWSKTNNELSSSAEQRNNFRTNAVFFLLKNQGVYIDGICQPDYDEETPIQQIAYIDLFDQQLDKVMQQLNRINNQEYDDLELYTQDDCKRVLSCIAYAKCHDTIPKQALTLIADRAYSLNPKIHRMFKNIFFPYVTTLISLIEQGTVTVENDFMPLFGWKKIYSPNEALAIGTGVLPQDIRYLTITPLLSIEYDLLRNLQFTIEELTTLQNKNPHIKCITLDFRHIKQNNPTFTKENIEYLQKNKKSLTVIDASLNLATMLLVAWYVIKPVAIFILCAISFPFFITFLGKFDFDDIGRAVQAIVITYFAAWPIFKLLIKFEKQLLLDTIFNFPDQDYEEASFNSNKIIVEHVKLK